MTRDETTPDGRWTFDADVTEAFDDMLRRSIPQYDVMRDAVTDVGSSFVRDGTAVVDLGCSRGEALARLTKRFGPRVSYVGVDVSEPMLEVARERFAAQHPSLDVSIRSLDLRTDFPRVSASLVLAVLTVQFTPIEYRQAILSRTHDALVPGGAFVLVEKVLGQTARLDGVFVDSYYAMKRDHGYTQEAIDRKRLSLEGVLVPVTASMNESFLQSAGFREVECFWRWMNFAAWVAVK